MVCLLGDKFMAMQTEKLTISVPSDLLKLTDEIAKEKNVSRSKLISSCLRDLADKRLEARMIEGYKAIAKDNLKFAENSIHLANEVLTKE
jgi:metal-responsive CopG/Arc/MetJ family transcriptional regulator